MKERIFKHYDSGDVCRIAVYVCVDEDPEHGKPIHVHLFQGFLAEFPKDAQDFTKKVYEINKEQVVLTVKDLPKLFKEIKRAVQELRAEKEKGETVNLLCLTTKRLEEQEVLKEIEDGITLKCRGCGKVHGHEIGEFA